MILILVGCQWQVKIERFRQLKIEHFVDDAECDSYARLGRDPGASSSEAEKIG